MHRQRVENQQPSCKCFANTGNQLERFAGLRRADNADERREHAHRRAPRFLQLVAFAEQAVIARAVRRANIEHRDLSVEAERRARHKRLPRSDARAIDRMAGYKIVGAIEHDVGFRHERRQFGCTDSRRDLINPYIGIDCGKARGSGIDLGASDIRRRIKNLPLQIGEIDVIGIA